MPSTDLPYPFDRHKKRVPNEVVGKHVPKQTITKERSSVINSMPKTIGNVFSQEWRDLLKFIAVSKGSTEVPDGLQPMQFRPGNLPPQSLPVQESME